MKRLTWCLLVFFCIVISLAAAGCGDSENSEEGSLSVYLADAKPALPVGDIEHVWVTFSECSIHKAEGEWIPLVLANDAATYTIDLLQFTDGARTALVLPASLESGTYTQIRIGVVEAKMEASGDVEYPLEIPSNNLKTDENVELDLSSDGSVAIVVHFDLSQSIVATGSGTYKLKPVLHVLKDASAITGVLDTTIFGDAADAAVVVYRDEDADGVADEGEEYTRLTVEKADADVTAFAVYWVIPDQDYLIEILVDETSVYDEAIAGADIPGGTSYALNEGAAID